ncbi:glycosyltransferase [Bacillus cereus]|uniref:glycosyltransferase n=1 Tax=Bacillus cereus TaxID=1396 RepID=UPI00397F9CAC
MSYEIYLMMGSVDVVRGGMTKALLKRANILAEQYDKVNILTFNYNVNYDQIRQQLYHLNLLKPNVILHNMYESFSDKRTCMWNPYEDGKIVENKKHRGVREFDNGLYQNYKAYRSDKSLLFIDYFNERAERVKREDYNKHGKMVKAVYIDLITNKEKQAVFYDENGRAYITKWLNRETGDVERIFLFGTGKKEKLLANEDELKKYWIEKMVENDENPIIISDSRSTDDLLQSITDENVGKVVVIHSSHLNRPYKYGSPLVAKNEKTLEVLNEFDAAVFLTQEQKQDITNRFGNRSTYYAISHSASKVELNKQIKKDDWKAVVVSRFTSLKNIDHTIRAFKGVVQQLPKAKLEIWGFGPEEEKLQQLILDQGLEESVTIKGFTTNAVDVFQNAAFSIVTSKSEGFGMVISESMSVGTPVISYDIKYGPRDMIRDYENGILVQENDEHALEEAMIFMFKNRKMRKQMSREAVKIVEELSDQKFLQQWTDLFKAVTEQKTKRVVMKKPRCRLTSLQWSHKETGTLKIEGTIQVPKEYKDDLQLALYVRHREEVIDGYSPVTYSWKDKETVVFTTEVVLGYFLEGDWISKGVWDVYMSFSVRNFHEFIRLGKRKSKEVAQFQSYIHHKQETIFPYFTSPYGNLSIDVGEQMHTLSEIEANEVRI